MTSQELDVKFTYLNSYKNIPNYSNLNCEQISSLNASKVIIKRAQNWSYEIMDDKMFLAKVKESERF